MEQTPKEQARLGTDTPESPSRCLSRDWVLLWILGLALIVAVSHQSLWIDEADTARFSSQGSLHDWWGKLRAMGAEMQLPFFQLYMWGWVKLVGNSEWALRVAGLIWLVPGLVAMASGFPRRTQRLAAMLVAVTSAFAWYYVGEARTYAMMLGASCLIFGALFRLGGDELGEKQQSRWLSGFLFGFLILCGSSLIGAVWSIAPFIAAVIVIPRQRLLELWKSGWRRIVVTGLLLLVLGLYYFWTLSVGARATAVGTTNWKTIAFVFYEQFGWTGLGPGRIELREAGAQSLRPYFLPLAVYFVLFAILMICGIRQVLRPDTAKRIRALSLAVALPAVMLLGVGFATHFRVLGRHFTPLMPIWFGLLALGLATLWGKGGWIGKSLSVAYLLLSLYSCLSVRLALRHERDDYRDAAHDAELALRQKKMVWWDADGTGAWYYHLPLSDARSDPGHALLLANPSDEALAARSVPQLIVASKPDLFDNSGALARYISGHGFHLVAAFPAFTLWEAKE